MNAPPFPINPSVGDFFGNWVWNGARWVCSPAAGVRVVTQVFRASGPYMPSPGLVTAVVECLGGGGGGGGVGGLAVTQAGSGGGGGSGSYSRSALAAALVLGGVNVTIGAGGSASEAAPAPSGAPTTFGALVVASGGNGGNPATPTEWGAGGPGGGPGTGDLASPGNTGGNGYLISGLAAGSVGIEAGAGAASVYGGGVTGGGNQGTQLPGVSAAPNTGAGGTGGWSNWVAQGGGAVPGGAGGSGICIVTEYCWADSAADDCLNPAIKVDARVALTREPWPGPGPCPPGWGPHQIGYDSDD